MPSTAKILKVVVGLILQLGISLSSNAQSYHWVDRDGFHTVDQITKVPLEYRKTLPPTRVQSSLPFTREEDRDGAMYVWFILGQAGVEYPYIPAGDFPTSTLFKKVDKPQEGDVAWWKGYVALYREKGETLLSARGETPLKTMEKKRGKATWFRYRTPTPIISVPESIRAPEKALKTADAKLYRLEKAATFPPRVKNDTERDLLGKEWKKTVASLEALRKKFPDDPQVLRRLGVCYRRGFNLGIPDTWDRAEAFLLRVEVLEPTSADAYISLGALYGDTDIDYAPQAESQFRAALLHARKDQLPYIWWGLAVALHSQDKTKEALKTIDRLIALRPNDQKARELRRTIQEKSNGQ